MLAPSALLPLISLDDNTKEILSLYWKSFQVAYSKFE